MANNRIARTNDDIQRVLSELLRRVKDPRVQQGMLSVTRVETTADLRYAKVWISAYGVEDEKLDDAMDNLTEEEREAVFAVYGSGYTRKDYSEIMGIPRTTVNDQVTRGKKKIKKFY